MTKRPRHKFPLRRPGLKEAIVCMLEAGCSLSEISGLLLCSTEYARDIQDQLFPHARPPRRTKTQVLASLGPERERVVRDFIEGEAQR